MAKVPSASGAHWANRDNAPGSGRSGDHSTTFRRPPALSSDEKAPVADAGELSPSAYLPELPSTSWFADADRRTPDNAPAASFPVRTPGSGPTGDLPVRTPEAEAPAPVGEPEPAGQHRPAPKDEPVPPARTGRISFGASAGPISPSHRPTSAAALAVPAPRPISPAAPPRFPDPVPSHANTDPAGPAAPAGHPGRPDLTGNPDSADPVGLGGHAGPVGHAARRGPGGHAADRPETIYKPAQAHRAPAPGEPPRRRSRLTIFATAVLTALVLLGGGLAGMAYFSGDDTSMRQMLTLGAAGDDRTVTAPLDGRTTAQFELVAATTKATVRTADLGDDLYRITAPDGSGMRPSPVLSDDRVQLHLTPDGRRASGDVDVLLSSKVSWALRFTAAADEQIVDLSSGQLSGLDVLGGVRRFQLKLPKPIGTVPVHITGAIEDFSIQSPVGNPVRVQVDSGAKTVAAGKVTLKDVKPGSTLTPKDWKVTNRYDVDAAARVTLLSVSNAG